MSFVTSMIADERVGARNLGKEARNPALEQALNAVQSLDGKKYTELILVGEGRNLTISGGNDGRYIAFISINEDEAFHNLLNPGETSTAEVDVVAGGQLGSFPARQVVTLPMVVAAAKEFFETGKSSDELTWETQP
jgi:hypothetical protein